MGDALATWFEARTCAAGKIKNMRGGGSTLSALTLAELCYKTLLADGVEAINAARNKCSNDALERLVEANTLLSGIGFESSGLAAAHAVHNGLTVLPQTHAYQHGEKVRGVLPRVRAHRTGAARLPLACQARRTALNKLNNTVRGWVEMLLGTMLAP